MIKPPLDEIPLDSAPNLGTDSAEVVRVWVTQAGPSTVLINSGLFEDPETFGFLMSDVIEHGAKAYCQAYGLDIDDARERVWAGVSAGWRSLESQLTNNPNGSVN